MLDFRTYSCFARIFHLSPFPLKHFGRELPLPPDRSVFGLSLSPTLLSFPFYRFSRGIIFVQQKRQKPRTIHSATIGTSPTPSIFGLFLKQIWSRSSVQSGPSVRIPCVGARVLYLLPCHNPSPSLRINLPRGQSLRTDALKWVQRFTCRSTEKNSSSLAIFCRFSDPFSIFWSVTFQFSVFFSFLLLSLFLHCNHRSFFH